MNRIIFVLLSFLVFSGCAEKAYQFEFIELPTPGNSSLRAIRAVDEKIVWASGSQGQVLLTLDGGKNWRQMTVPGCEDTEFRSLHAWNSLRALVFDISPEGRAFMTTDGGLSWEQVYHSPVEGAFFNSLKFANDKQGIAISDPIDDQIFILNTEDGGWSWKRLEGTPLSVEGEINFAASNTCIDYLPSGEIYIVTGGCKARVLSSKDHGKSWTFAETPAMTGESAGLFSVDFQRQGTGVAVGGDFNDPARKGVRAIFTEDRGMHWQQAKSMPAGYRSCVVSINDELLFATGKTGCDFSTDNGRNWVFIDTLGYYTASAVDGKNLIFLAGSEGKAAKVIVREF
jgi:photosystem II stability/assembly factor-like uncharacterized protein